MKAAPNNTDPVLVACFYIVGGAMIIALLMLAGFFVAIFLTPFAVAYAGWKIYVWHRNRPTPTKVMYQEALDRISHVKFPDPVDYSVDYIKGIVATLPKRDWPSLPILQSMREIVDDLYTAEHFQSPEPPKPPLGNNPIEEGRYRDQIEIYTRKMGDCQTSINLFNKTLATIFGAVIKHLPAIARHKEGEANALTTVPLYTLMSKLPEVVETTAWTFFNEDVREHDLFNSIRQQITDNHPTDKRTKSVVAPTDFEGTPDDLIWTYLKNTPFLDLMKMPVPIEIPQEIRFSHQWIIAPPGSGKSTLLQSMILEDLKLVEKNEASIIVMDSNRELVKAVEGLKDFAPGHRLAGKLVSIDLEDIEYPFAINLFDQATVAGNATPLEKEMLRNQAVNLYSYFFDSLMENAYTALQGSFFNFTVELLMNTPEATLDTFIDIMQPKGIEPYRKYLAKCGPECQHFFKVKFDEKGIYEKTKSGVVDRLFTVKAMRSLSRMFDAKRSKFDFLEETNTHSKVITINVPVSLLGPKPTESVSRFFIAMILLAAQKRLMLPAAQRKPTFFYIDECHNIIKTDEKIPTILDEARKLKVGMILAHQRLNQITERKVLDALHGSTAIKYASNISEAGSSALASEMHCKSEFIAKQPPFHFAAYIKGVTDTAISTKIPHVDMLKMDRMDKSEHETVRDDIRARYSTLPKPPEPEPTPESQTTEDTAMGTYRPDMTDYELMEWKKRKDAPQTLQENKAFLIAYHASKGRDISDAFNTPKPIDEPPVDERAPWPR